MCHFRSNGSQTPKVNSTIFYTDNVISKTVMTSSSGIKLWHYFYHRCNGYTALRYCRTQLQKHHFRQFTEFSASSKRRLVYCKACLCLRRTQYIKNPGHIPKGLKLQSPRGQDYTHYTMPQFTNLHLTF
jgi:hypothetical protein